MPTLADVLRQTGYAQDGTLGTPTPIESPMTKALADHIKSIPQKFNENQAYQMELLGKAFPGNTYESMMTQGDPKAMAELAMQTPFNAMIAYHGTPHKILGNFDISKVGTGEGAQAYGHGMYFAENPNVAKSYATTGKYETPADYASHFLAESNQNPQEAIKLLKKEAALFEKKGWDKADISKDMIPQIEQALKTGQGNSNLYKVDIPDEHIPNMLDWDKPLNQQSAEVLNAIKIPKKAADRYNEIGNKLEELQWTKGGLDSPEWNKLFEEAKDIKAKYGLHRSGEELYREAYKVAQQAGAANPSQAAAESLKAQGIPGIRYLDEFSRNKNTGTSNFVIFDPSTVKILEENGKPLNRKELIEKQINKLK